MGTSDIEKRLAAAEARIDVLNVALHGVLLNFLTKSTTPQLMLDDMRKLLEVMASRKQSPEMKAAADELIADLTSLLMAKKRRAN